MVAVNGMGPVRKSLEKAWKDLGADMSAWTQTFTGNHVLKLLDEDAIDNAAHKRPSSIIPHVKQYLVAIGKIQKMCVAREMSAVEKEELNKQIDVLFFHLKKFAGAQNVTPKLHVLLEHVTAFVERNNTWAKTSEQSIEGLHAIVNSLKIQYRSIRKKELQMGYVFRSLLFYNQIFNSY
uniref:Uncharacterized protein n=3 Tax=Caenorhabditis japonica TaxID=281687 RepID=A0A8R1I5V3_CAEJA